MNPLYKTQYDKGIKVEQLVKQILENKGYSVTEAEPHQNMNEHWDLCYIKNEIPIYIDVKSRKKIKRADSHPTDDYLWIELLNVSGRKGWLYGKANFFVFEQTSTFIFVEAESLRVYIDIVFSETFEIPQNENVELDHLLFKKYTRSGKKDVLTLIPTLELTNNCTCHILSKSD